MMHRVIIVYFVFTWLRYYSHLFHFYVVNKKGYLNSIFSFLGLLFIK